MNERIKEIRNEQNLSQTAFAKKLSISRSAICKIESGENYPSEQTISLICTQFNINEQWLRNGIGNKYNPINTEYEEITTIIGVKDPKAKQAIINYWKLSDSDKDLFWKFIERFMK